MTTGERSSGEPREFTAGSFSLGKIFVTIGIFTAGLSVARASRFSSFFSHTVDVMSVTDMKPSSKRFPVPTKEQPIYYEAIDAGYKDFGRPIAGDTLPSVKLMRATVVRALAKNHYLSADNKHVATEIIVMSWGTLYMGGISIGQPPPLRFLAGDKYVDFGVRIIPVLSQSHLYDFASSDLYLVLLRAYSTRDANEGKIDELWETRIACPSLGLAMDTSLPEMVKLAAPHIGVDMKRAIFTTPEEGLREEIKLGELKVLADDVDVDAAHVSSLSDILSDSKSQADQKPAGTNQAVVRPNLKK